MKRLAILLTVLFAAASFAQDLPKIAVYVTGNVGEAEKTALGTRMLVSLVNSGRYRGIERSSAFLAEIEKEHVKQRSGAIDDSQISALGKQFGVRFVCIANITSVFGAYQVSARIVNVETAEIEFIGDASSPLRTMGDLEQVSNQVVKSMFSAQLRPAPEPVAQAEPAEPEPQAAPAREPEPKPEPVPAPAPKAALNVKPKPAAVPPPPTASAGPERKIPLWVTIGLDAVGAGIVAFGVYQDAKVTETAGYKDNAGAVMHARNRNVAYVAGGAVLATGISFHIFF